VAHARPRRGVGTADGYVVSFVPFHKREVVTPPHRFLQGLLHHYGIKL
jgi:hypothetical protein